MQRVSPTPLHLAKLVLLGLAIAVMAYAAVFLPFPRPIYRHGLPAMLWSVRLKLLCVVLPLLMGLGIAYWNNYRLSRGVNRLRYADEDLEEVRRFLNRRWLKAAQLVTYLAVFALAMVQLASHSPRNNLGVILLFAANPLTYLRASLAKQPAASKPIDWTHSQPIRSDRWGQAS